MLEGTLNISLSGMLNFEMGSVLIGLGESIRDEPEQTSPKLGNGPDTR